MPENPRIFPENGTWQPSPQDFRDVGSVLKPPEDATPYMLLKGHVLLESHLQGLIAAASRVDGWRPDPGQSFIGMIQTIERKALLPEAYTKALRLLNKVRNDYVHRFSERVTREHVDFVARPFRDSDEECYRTLLADNEQPVEGCLSNLLRYMLLGVMMFRTVFSDRGLSCKIRRLQQWLVVFVPRSAVERCDTSGTMAKLNLLIATGEAVAFGKGRLYFEVEEDQSENAVVQDQKIKAFVAKLDAEFPYWLMFHELQTEQLKWICASLSSSEERRDGKRWIPPEEVKRFFEPRLTAMRELCERFDLREAWEERSSSTMAYFGIQMME